MNHYDNIAAGQIPSGIKDKTLCLRELVSFARKYKAIIAVLVASARRDDFKNDIVAWVEWAGNNGFSGSELHHLRQIGDLLLDAKGIDEKLYSRLFVIDTEKLKSIQRLNRKDLVKFLAAYPPEKLTREEIRAAVCECLGEEPKTNTSKSSKYQPTLWDSIDALCEKDARDFQDAAMGDDFSQDKALKVAFSGLGLLTVSTTYWKKKGAEDAQMLAAVESELRKEADALADVRNNITAKLQSAG